MIRLIRNLILKHQIERNIRKRKIIREARAQSSYRGVSTEWRKRGELARKTFGIV